MESIDEETDQNDVKQDDEQLDEPMELDDDDDQMNTIIEVNNTSAQSSSFQFADQKKLNSNLTDDELLKKATLQIDCLKQMEMITATKQKTVDDKPDQS